MDKLIRLFAIVLLAVFGAGTVAHASNATSMSIAMSPAAMGDGDMGDCEGCPPGEDGKAQICGQACLVPFAAIPAAVGIELPLVAADIVTSPLEEIAGRTALPEPYPPRTTILS
ncbi:MAG: hypothetical protein E5X43_01125 [Mesorhizobium sp.]|nr:MAG: hypothetical protein EOR45_32605 [Mesorhizobium sp.]TJX07384.1 MAG: hypothetical protein E5X43_01125 [Mesorhizobium sp.]